MYIPVRLRMCLGSGSGCSPYWAFAVCASRPESSSHAYEMGLDRTQWAAAIAFAIFMAYSEGYRGFQLKFSPRTAARVRYLRDQPNVLRSLLGPVLRDGLLPRQPASTKIVAWALTTFVVTLVIVVQLARPALARDRRCRRRAGTQLGHGHAG